MANRELGTTFQTLVDRYTLLPEEEQIFCNRIFSGALDIAEQRAEEKKNKA